MSATTHQVSESLWAYVAKQDDRLNAKAGWKSDPIRHWLTALLQFGRVEVGWRESCGTTDQTMQAARVWWQVVKRLERDGIRIEQERVKHGNAYATNKGGFWNSVICTLKGGAT